MELASIILLGCLVVLLALFLLAYITKNFGKLGNVKENVEKFLNELKQDKQILENRLNDPNTLNSDKQELRAKLSNVEKQITKLEKKSKKTPKA